MKHYVKIFYANFMDTLEKEVNDYISQVAFQGSTAKIENIQSVARDSSVVIVVHYVSPYEIR